MRPEDPVSAAYGRLAAAIVQKAAEDYEEALTGLIRAETRAVRKHSIDEKREVERFFRSEWFRGLCDLDSIAVIEALEKKVLDREMKTEKKRLIKALEAYHETWG